MKCPGCGTGYRKGTTVLLLSDRRPRSARVCSACARHGAFGGALELYYKVASHGRWMTVLGQTRWPLGFAICYAEDLRRRGYADAHVQLAVAGVGPLALTAIYRTRRP